MELVRNDKCCFFITISAWSSTFIDNLSKNITIVFFEKVFK